MRAARNNVSVEGGRVEGLDSVAEIGKLMKGAGGSSGESGYVNWGSGWADAAGAMKLVMDKVLAYGDRVEILRGRAERLLFSNRHPGPKKKKVIGVRLETGREKTADLTILAAGAWTGSLIDLRGIVEARGQAVAYIRLSHAERRRLTNMPILLNLGTGMFVIPPPPPPDPEDQQGGILKVARHGFGYRNPVPVPALGGIQVSLPAENYSVLPHEARHALRAFLAQLIPWLATRPFCEERLCWYTDTPTADFLVDWHPEAEGLFVATGGSGHGFKFLPVLGDCIVDILEGKETEGVGAELRELWRWRQGGGKKEVECEDGSRGGRRGMLFAEEMARGESRL